VNYVLSGFLGENKGIQQRGGFPGLLQNPMLHAQVDPIAPTAKAIMTYMFCLRVFSEN